MVSGQIQHTCVVTAAPEKMAWLWCLVDYISDFTPTVVSFQVLSEITGNNNIIPAYSNTKHLILYSLEYSEVILNNYGYEPQCSVWVLVYRALKHVDIQWILTLKYLGCSKIPPKNVKNENTAQCTDLPTSWML